MGISKLIIVFVLFLNGGIALAGTSKTQKAVNGKVVNFNKETVTISIPRQSIPNHIKLKKGLDVSLFSIDAIKGRTPAQYRGDALHDAAVSGNIRKAANAIKNGANVNAQGEGGWTPLMRAADVGHASVVRLLIASGADVNISADPANCTTALDIALGEDSSEVIDILLKAGATLGQCR